MEDSIVIELLQNTAVLLAFALLYENFWIREEKEIRMGKKILTGIILSGIGVVLMFNPWSWVPGVVFDTRSVMISISGLFFGTVPTIITMFVTSIIRLIMGGDGQWMGIAVIISSGTIGLLWRNLRPNWKSKNYYMELLAMGILVHIAMSLCTLLLPPDRILPTLKIIALPLIFIYSPSTMLLGVIMLRQYGNTQNKQAKLKLAESERRLTQVLESGNIISLLVNADGSIKYCNNYFLKVTGYSLNEVQGKNWFNIFIPNDIRDETHKLFSESTNSKNITNNYEGKILAKNGDLIYISWYNTVFHSNNGEVIGIASVGVNITDSKIYEGKLEEKNKEYKEINKKLKEAKEKAEESERLKSAFLANMSHEIRTPMNGILGFADLLKRPDLLAEKQKQYVEIIEKSGARMLSIINDIIEISQIEAGIIQANIEELNLNEIFGYLYGFFKPEVENKGLLFSSRIPDPSNKAIVNTDREKLQSVLTNLLKNAIKFTTKGSIEFGYALNEKHVTFFVKDTGIGIPENKLTSIFERFVQADIEDEMALQGSGLGLAISRAYVELLGGRIWVESEKGKGSTFYFTILSNREKDKTEVAAGTVDETFAENPMKGMKILLAEDDETSGILFEILLGDYCREILIAKTGAEAIEMCRSNPDIDLILMDIKLPVLNGISATQQIRQFNRNVIIIAQTAYALSGDKEKALEAGCNDYIPKPISRNKLIELVKKYYK